MSIGVSVPDAATVARKQKVMLIGGGVGLFALLLFMMWLADDSGKKDANTASATATAKTEQVEAVARKISDEEVWTAKADAAMQEMRRNNEAMKQQMEQVKRENEDLRKTMQDQDASVKAMQDAAAKASVPPPPTPPSELDSIVPPVQAGQQPSGGNLPPMMPAVPGMMGGLPATPPAMEEDSGIVHITVGDEPEPALLDGEGKGAANLPPEVKPISQSPGDNPSKPIDAPSSINVANNDSHGRPLPQKRARPKSKTYIPSGSFFSAELIAALDAPTGGNAEQNPHPALLLVKDNAFLPNKFRSKVKECHVLASGYGDISSERVNLRTEKMSCVLKDGTVIDTKLDAYVAGEDGKAGLRGNLVSKQGALVANAMLAGTLGGVGQGLAQAATTVTQTGTGAVTSVSPNQALEFGMYSGSGSALNKLADYYIKAAEKTFPILEIAAGREATIILLEGLDIDAETSNLAGSAGQRATLPIVTADDISQAGKAIRREVDSW
jgi:conjugal transfer pilus assembly protein TraB